MSASNRKISRLPLSVFQDLVQRPKDDNTPEDLKAAICQRLGRKKGGESVTTIGQLLRLSRYTLMVALDPLLTYEEVRIFLDRVCHQCAPSAKTVLELYQNSTQREKRYLPTSLPSLDRILCGGLRVSTVNELVGASGVGKTQLAFQLCLTAAKFQQGAIYIDTEQKISLDRLGEMSGEWHVALGQNASYAHPKTVLDNLTVHQPSNSEELLQTLDELEYEILIRNNNDNNKDRNNSCFPVRLLVVDSIAAPMRREFGTDSAPQRAAAVVLFAQKLKRLADQLSLVVLVINQVGANANAAANANANANDLRAALGTAWYHCVSTRLFMETVDDDVENESKIKSISVVKSHRTALGETRFRITTMGIVEASPDDGDNKHCTALHSIHYEVQGGKGKDDYENE